MTAYLASVFKVLYELQPDTEMTANVSAAELAAVTAEHAFEEADLNHDGRLSFEEFSRWYAESEGAQGGGGGGGGGGAVEDDEGEGEGEWGESDEGEEGEGEGEGGARYNLLELRRLANLETYTADEVFEVFAEEADDDGLLAFAGVEACFQRLVRVTDHAQTPRSRDVWRTRAIVQRLYALFAVQSSGEEVAAERFNFGASEDDEDYRIDFSEFMCGLTVLCGGGPLDKIEAAFSLFDLEGDGHVGLGDVERYLASVFAVLFQTTLVHQAKVTRTSGIGSAELAPIVAAQCFDEVGVDRGTGRISAEQFHRWQTENEGSAGLGGMAAAATIGEDDWDSDGDSSDGEFDEDVDDDDEEEEEEEEEEGWSEDSEAGGSGGGGGHASDRRGHPMRSLAEARSLTKLEDFDVEDVFEIFEEVAVDGEIDRRSFDACFENIVKLAGGHPTMALVRRTRATVDRLWALFHTDGSGAVDFSELACGLSVLSGSAMDDKVAAAFNLFDVDGEGTISLDEFTCYICSVFRVLFEAQPHVAERMSEVTADELAAVTARQCFGDAELDAEGNLSFEQFKEWCLQMDV